MKMNLHSLTWRPLKEVEIVKGLRWLIVKRQGMLCLLIVDPEPLEPSL